jgi:hypothetical protein
MTLSRLIFVSLALFVASVAQAWGPEGHRVTGYVAGRLLSLQTRQHLAELGIYDLAATAVYMDEKRQELEAQFPHSSRWHYDNRSVCEPHPEPREFCRKGECATYQIERWRAVLQNSQSSRADKRDAVRFLVHMIGDLHQPLHMANDDDRGGNDLYVWLPREREPRRLHEVWDTRLVTLARARRAESNWSKELLDRYTREIPAWQRGTVEDWARESHQLAVDVVYANLPGVTCHGRSTDHVELTREYVDQGKDIVPTQLTKAGVRIAMVLNAALE